MSPIAQQILDSFEHLPQPEQRELASVILRRAVELELLPLTDEELIWTAEDLFVELDQEEEQGEQSTARSSLVS